MNHRLRRLGRAVASLVAEDRPAFKRIDVSAASPDAGTWLNPRP